MEVPISERGSHSERTSVFRLAWAIGGGWERFFLLWPWIWVTYGAAIMLWFPWSGKPVDALVRFAWVALSAAFLVDAWVMPILSGKVLRAAATRDESTDESNALALADYLQSYHHGGRWLVGSALSLAYAVLLLVWGAFSFFAADATALAGIWVFLAVHLVLVFSLLALYEVLLGGFLRKVSRSGHSLRMVRRPWFWPFLGLTGRKQP